MGETYQISEDEEFLQNIKVGMADEKRKVKNIVWLWEPSWETPLDYIEWHLAGARNLADKILEVRPNGSRFKYRVRLQDGRDELHLTYHYVNHFYPDYKFIAHNNQTRLILHTESGRHGFDVHSVICEMTALYAIAKTPVQVAAVSRATEILDKAVSDQEVSFYGMLADTGRCDVCNRKLKDPVSKILRIGPECARQSGLPHDFKIARKVQLWREQQEVS